VTSSRSVELSPRDGLLPCSSVPSSNSLVVIRVTFAPTQTQLARSAVLVRDVRRIDRSSPLLHSRGLKSIIQPKNGAERALPDA
jgi:hypothetical protein